VERGFSGSVAFIEPAGPVWPLPLYELALMTAERAEDMDIDDLELVLVTPNPQPLAVFGRAVSDVVTDRLAQAGITVYCNARAKVPAARHLLIESEHLELHPERMIALPRIAGPAIRGLAGGGAFGFLPIDEHCAVPGTDGRVFAAGDAADYPIKHGSLGTQMADTAAEAIAVLAGSETDAPAFNPIIRGKLLTGRDPVFMSAHPTAAGSFESEVFDTPPWPADEKVIADELGPYLEGLGSAAPT
jgi:sulfide:quinone oxidoreductase